MTPTTSLTNEKSTMQKSKNGYLQIRNLSTSSGISAKTSYTTFQPDKQQQNRAPRKQTLMTDFKKVILSNIQYKIGQNVECICSH